MYTVMFQIIDKTQNSQENFFGTLAHQLTFILCNTSFKEYLSYLPNFINFLMSIKIHSGHVCSQALFNKRIRL